MLLVERDGRLVFGGGSVCFPNRWDLRSKLGLSMAGVHAPVAQLNEQLEAPIDSFFDRLTPQRSFWRLGWGILDTPDWYTPLDGTAGAAARRSRARPVLPARRARDIAAVPGDELCAVHDPHLRRSDPRRGRRRRRRTPPGRLVVGVAGRRSWLQGRPNDRRCVDCDAARNPSARDLIHSHSTLLSEFDARETGGARHGHRSEEVDAEDPGGVLGRHRPGQGAVQPGAHPRSRARRDDAPGRHDRAGGARQARPGAADGAQPRRRGRRRSSPRPTAAPSRG